MVLHSETTSAACAASPSAESPAPAWLYEFEYDQPDRRYRHFAVQPDGARRYIDHTGRERISPEAFDAHVALGFPTRRPGTDIFGCPASWPWRNETIIAALAKAGGASC